MDIKTTHDRQRSNLQTALASQILDLVRAQELQPGSHLSELRLAEVFGISRSPVRSALKLLAERGLVKQEPNRGYFLAAAAEQLAEVSAELPRSEEEALYLEIAHARIENKLPDHVTEADLGRLYGARRGLLTRVLSRMAEEGLIRRSKGHGWHFLPALLTEDAHDESYRFRLLIEPAGFQEPTFAVDPEKLALLRRQHQRLLQEAETATSADLFQSNADFHETLASFSGNRYILQAVQHQNHLRRLLEVKGFRDTQRIRQSCSEHLEIIGALERGDRELASILLRRHLTVASRLKIAFTEGSRR